MMDRSGDEVRTASTMGLPDPRMENYVIRETLDGPSRPMTIAAICASIDHLKLVPTVAEDVSRQFALACNLYIYSWHVYGFHAASQLQALRTLELALRCRLKNPVNIKRLSALIDRALAARILRPDDFSPQLGVDTWGSVIVNHERKKKGQPPLEPWEQTVEFIRTFRNDLAHGVPWLHPNSLAILQLVANLINALHQQSSPEGASGASP